MCVLLKNFMLAVQSIKLTSTILLESVLAANGR